MSSLLVIISVSPDLESPLLQARKNAAAAGIVVKTPVWVGFDGKNAVEIKVRPMFSKEGAGARSCNG